LISRNYENPWLFRTPGAKNFQERHQEWAFVNYQPGNTGQAVPEKQKLIRDFTPVYLLENLLPMLAKALWL
jgi:hypothetical protein